MVITTAPSRLSKNWKVQEISFERLVERINHPTVTNETYLEFAESEKEVKANIKDVGGFVLGRLKANNGRRTGDNLESRSGIALDLDFLNKSDLKTVNGKLKEIGYKYCLYSTHSSTPEKPRIRILFPLKREVNPDEYEFLTRYICEQIGLNFFDKTTAQPVRLMFWPSVSVDMQDTFISDSNLEFEPLAPDSIFSIYPNWTDRTTWPVFPGETPTLKDSDKKLDDPRDKKGIIGLFCRTYSIPEVIETYLSDVYEPTDEEDRYTYKPGSSAKGAVLYGRAEYQEDVFLYSFHDTDPVSGKMCNAFDLVRIHKFGDTKASMKKMEALAFEDRRVKSLMAKETAENTQDFIESVRSDPDYKKEEWREVFEELQKTLDKDERNRNKNASTIYNVLQILRRDLFFAESYYYDSFADKVVIKANSLPWPGPKEQRNWKDSDDDGLRMYLEKTYGIRGKETVLSGLNISFEERSVHPVKDYLESLEWDGTSRVDTLLIDYFGAEDNVYTRDVIRKALVAAITRIYEPGAKFDTMPILVGPQGIGKSTFINKIGKDWYSDSVTDFVGKDSYELLQNNWLIEIPELNGFSRYEMNQIKHFLSKQVDEYRAPYQRRKESHPRQCIFFGTTNDEVFLRDKTGNRRFWPVQLGVNQPTKNVFKDLTDEEIDGIWAEAYVDYRLGEDLYLEGESKTISESEQRKRLEDDPREGMIVEFIKRPIPIDWDKWSLEQRQAYWLDPESFDDVETKKRDRICAQEIGQELFDIPASKMDYRFSKGINDILKGLEGAERLDKAVRFYSLYRTTGGYKIDPDKL